MRADGLGVTEDTVAVIGEGRATTWKLPGGTFLPGATMNVEDSTRTIVLSERGLSHFHSGIIALTSSDLRYVIALLIYPEYKVFSATTGERLGNFSSRKEIIWSTPDGHIGNSHSVGDAEIWKITTEGIVEKSARWVDTSEERWGFPYISHRGYRVEDDGWYSAGAGGDW